jgi:hypothetical protein
LSLSSRTRIKAREKLYIFARAGRDAAGIFSMRKANKTY